MDHPTWTAALEWTPKQIRIQAYPPGAAALLEQGEAEYLALDVEGKGSACLQAKVLLRMCLHFHRDLSPLRPLLQSHFRERAVLFAFEDLLRRMPPALASMLPSGPPLAGIPALELWNAVQYRAEFAQDLASGLFQPTD